MIVGFEYEHTIKSHQKRLTDFAQALQAGGSDVVVIGTIPWRKDGDSAKTMAKRDRTEKQIKKDLDSLGFPHDQLLVVAVKNEKETPDIIAKLATLSGIEVYFDNREDVCVYLQDYGISAFKTIQVPQREVWDDQYRTQQLYRKDLF